MVPLYINYYHKIYKQKIIKISADIFIIFIFFNVDKITRVFYNELYPTKTVGIP
jgi:hypothetical protein